MFIAEICIQHQVEVFNLEENVKNFEFNDDPFPRGWASLSWLLMRSGHEASRPGEGRSKRLLQSF